MTCDSVHPSFVACERTHQEGKEKWSGHMGVKKRQKSPFTVLIKQLNDTACSLQAQRRRNWPLCCLTPSCGSWVRWGQRPGQRKGEFNSSVSPRSSGRHTGKPLELCTSERPEGEERKGGLKRTDLSAVLLEGSYRHDKAGHDSSTPDVGNVFVGSCGDTAVGFNLIHLIKCR